MKYLLALEVGQSHFSCDMLLFYKVSSGRDFTKIKFYVFSDPPKRPKLLECCYILQDLDAVVESHEHRLLLAGAVHHVAVVLSAIGGLWRDVREGW